MLVSLPVTVCVTTGGSTLSFVRPRHQGGCQDATTNVGIGCRAVRSRIVGTSATKPFLGTVASRTAMV